ncbi:MAG: branched-chain amino acid ABC transporter permease [Candidatus Methylomirabilia bacterium]
METLTAIVIDGIIYAAWLFLISVGMTLIYGVLRILNVAHGSLYALGAYAGASMVIAYLATGYTPYLSYLVLLGAALGVGLVVGPLIERGVLRWVYGRDEVLLLLVTYSIFLILEDVIKLIWGVDPYYASQPYGLLGRVSVAGLIYPAYDFLVIACGAMVGFVLWWMFNRTKSGRLVIAIIHDREISLAMGINVPRVYLIAFSGGAALAALGGALTAPRISVVPGIAVEVIVLAFAVVVIGGLGSLGGAALGALMVGLVRAATVHLLPQLELFIIYGVMALVLLLRPQGLFGRIEVRRI